MMTRMQAQRKFDAVLRRAKKTDRFSHDLPDGRPVLRSKSERYLLFLSIERNADKPIAESYWVGLQDQFKPSPVDIGGFSIEEIDEQFLNA